MSQDHLQYQPTTAISATSTSQHHQEPHQRQPNSSDNSNNSNTTYRPCSPDLSAYIVPLHQQQAIYQQNQQTQPSLFHPSYQENLSADQNNNNHHSANTAASWQRQGSSTALTGLPTGSGGSYPPVTHRGSYDASPYFSPQGSFSLGQGQGSYFIGGSGSGSIGGQQQQGQGPLQRRDTLGYGNTTAGVGEYSNNSRLTHSPTAATSGERFGVGREFPPPHQPSFAQTSASGFSAAGQEQGSDQAPVNQSLPSSYSHQQTQQYPQHNMPPSRRKRGQTDENEDSGDFDYAPEASAGAGGAAAKTSRKRKSDHGQTLRAPGDVGPSLGIDVKTKFPVARIKRIMQADEDVGKVAQATPTAVSKALELFMITLVTKATAEAKDRSSKRVTAAHLKQAVIKDQTFDFLQEIIEKVPDPTEKKGGRAASEDVDDGAGGGPAKRKRAPRGKKKTDDDEG